ncbi:MAG TPA: DUF3280 domain-containing protein [Casimicrobiaceae bacterium]|jgi:hypothetical protein
MSHEYRQFLLLIATCILGILLAAPYARAEGQTLKTIAILDFDLLDDQHELAPANVEYRRLDALRDQLEQEIAGNGLYEVIDRRPASAMIQKYRSETQLYMCNGCELTIARSLGADRVMVGWVQKVSNLILNINIQIEDVKTGEILLRKSVDLRGNTDQTWSRGMSYLVRSMVEKGQGNR